MKIIPTKIPDIKLIEPTVFNDNRGYFFESYNQARFEEHIGNFRFVQDNESLSHKGTLRGLHYQLPPFAQSKLVRVIQGHVLDVAVDIRKGSPTFGKHLTFELSEENKRQVFVPRGFAHGFVVLSDTAIFSYKVDNVYSKESERGIAFDDPALGIDWQLGTSELLLSEKDTILPSFENADHFDYGVDLYA